MISKYKSELLTLQTEMEKWKKKAKKNGDLAKERLDKLKVAWQSEATFAKKLAVAEGKLAMRGFYNKLMYLIKRK